MERPHIEGSAAAVLARCPDTPVYTAPRETLQTLTGYALTRGVLCAMRRPKQHTVEELCQTARRVAVLEGIVDSTNIGAIFRSAAALGMGRRASLALLLRPALPPCGAGQHGHGIPGTLGTAGGEKHRMARGRYGPPAQTGL